MAATHEQTIGNGHLEDPDHWASLAQQHWSKPAKAGNIKSSVIKEEIWDVLEEEGFTFRSLYQLESLQLMEKCVDTQ